MMELKQSACERGVLLFILILDTFGNGVALPLSQPVNCSAVRLQDGTFRYEVEEGLQARAADSSCHAEWSSQDKPIAIFTATDHSTLPPVVRVSMSFLLSEECVPDLLYKLECPSSGVSEKQEFLGLNSSDTEEMDQPALSWKFWVSVALSPLILIVLLLAGVCVARVLCPERVPLVQAAVEWMKGIWTVVATEEPGGGGEAGGEGERWGERWGERGRGEGRGGLVSFKTSSSELTLEMSSQV